VVAATIDKGGLASLRQFVTQFNPRFDIGAMDDNTINDFAQWGPRRTFVPQLFLIDKTGVIRNQAMGTDPMLEEDQLTHLRAAVNELMHLTPAAPKAPAATSAAKKK